MTNDVLIFVCSRLREFVEKPNEASMLCQLRVHTIEDNKLRAAMLCRMISDLGDSVIPISTALYCSQFLDDDIPEERERGIKIGHSLMGMCDILFVDRVYGVSSGMAQDIKEWGNSGMQFIYLSDDKNLESLVRQIAEIKRRKEVK